MQAPQEPHRSLSCLVLNADYRPLSTFPPSIISSREALEAVFRNRVDVVEEWDTVFRSASLTVNAPKTVALKNYANISQSPKFCRRSIYLRDRYRCQYCGERFPSEELTFDHVIPRSKGGKTIWTNILTACIKCNSAKADKMVNHSGRKAAGEMRPLKMPRQPTASELLRAGAEFMPDKIREDWASWLYWNTELEP